jgi:hypothetical protein
VDQTVRSLFSQGIASSTSRTYSSGVRRYLSFCSSYNLDALPLSQATLCRFVAFLFNSHLTPPTIRSYLSALRFYQIAEGGLDPGMTEWPQLHYVLRAVRRTRPAIARPARLPITPDVLHKLYTAWSPNRMLWAACCLGFSGFLRSGEFTCPCASAYTSSMLSPGDVATDNVAEPSFLSVTLRSSKTDIFGVGHTMYIGVTGNHLCPVKAVLSYMAFRPPIPGPLFIHQDGQPLSRPQLVQAVRSALQSAGLQVDGFNGHGFRIGAATTAAQAGIPDSLIQTLGSWKSSAFL